MKIKIGSFSSNSKEFYGELIITCDCHNTFTCWYEKDRINDTETKINCPYCGRKVKVS